MKIRTLPKNNYRGILIGNHTLRVALNPKLPITELDYPEFYDIKLTEKCHGNCSYCYMGSEGDLPHGKNIPKKLNMFFGDMTEDQKPFQIAYGGGEPTLHPEFNAIMKTTKELGIMPNYTTNGMHLSNSIIETTQKYCGGVAVSAHPHLDSYWNAAICKLIKAGIKTNIHLIISDKKSIDRFKSIRNKYKGVIDYFVLLAYEPIGRAKKKELNFNSLFDYIRKEQINGSSIKDIAFGALFYDELIKKSNKGIAVSLYEPESMSKYIDLITMKLHPSSFMTDITLDNIITKKLNNIII